VAGARTHGRILAGEGSGEEVMVATIMVSNGKDPIDIKSRRKPCGLKFRLEYREAKCYERNVMNRNFVLGAVSRSPHGRTLCFQVSFSFSSARVLAE
jgi:hypothetical protein